MTEIEAVEWEACCIEPVRDRELERHIRREMGFVPSSIRYYTECPWLARSRARSNFLAAKLVHIPLELAEKIALVVAQDNSCRYCFYGVRTLLRLMGLPEQHIRRVEQDLLTADVDPRERAVLLFARRLSRSNPLLTPRDLEPLQAAGFSAEAIREVALMAENGCVANRLSKNWARFRYDEFNVDLGNAVRSGETSIDKDRLHLNHTRDTRQGMLLHGLERSGYVGFISFKSEGS